MPVKFHCQNLSTEFCLADFGILLPADKAAVQRKLQGTPEYIAPERLHGHDPSPVSDMWSFMATFVYLYLGETVFPGRPLYRNYMGETRLASRQVEDVDFHCLGAGPLRLPIQRSSQSTSQLLIKSCRTM
jgi:serine/threonine protein kinase